LDFFHDLQFSNGGFSGTDEFVFSVLLPVVAFNQERAINIVETELANVENEWFPNRALVVENMFGFVNYNPV